MRPRWEWNIGYVRDPERSQEGYGWQDVYYFECSSRLVCVHGEASTAKFVLMRTMSKHEFHEVGLLSITCRHHDLDGG
jgi:hypothetical protein